jgi:hypothetical protein
MDTSGTPSPILVSQKRLTVVLSFLALLGSIALGIVWWDSTRNFTMYGTNYGTDGVTISLFRSGIVFELEPNVEAPKGYKRESYASMELIDEKPPWHSPYWSRYPTDIPICLVILTYLATLLLIWLVLMNRLARREFMRQRDA